MSASPRTTKQSRPQGEPKRRTKPAEVRREELLDAAEQLFLDQGLTATSVDDIVSRADVAKGTFYLHFASKEAIVLGLQDRFLERCHAHIEKALARKKPDDHRGRLRAWIQASVEVFVEQFRLHEIVFHEFRPEEDKHEKIDNRVFGSFIELLRQGTLAGAFDLADPELSGMMLLHGFHGATHWLEPSQDAAARRQVMKALETFALRVVGG